MNQFLVRDKTMWAKAHCPTCGRDRDIMATTRLHPEGHVYQEPCVKCLSDTGKGVYKAAA